MSKIIDGQFEVDENNKLIKYIDDKIEVVIPDGVTKIGKSAFYELENLKSVEIPDSVIEIENAAFSQCKNLKSIHLPDNLTKIGVCTFDNCENLTSITIPNSVKKIGYGAFYNCENLTSITLPESLTEIEDYAFDSKYIKEINLYSYKIFSLLDNNLKVIALNTIIKNKQQFSKEEINKFAEYIIENKNEILKYIIKNSYLKDLLTFILDDIYIFYTEEEINSILNEMNNQIDIEIKAMLLEYSNKIRNSNINPLDEFDLGTFDEETIENEDLGEKTK